MTNSNTQLVPDWLNPQSSPPTPTQSPSTPATKSKQTSHQLSMQLLDTQFTALFEPALDKISQGIPLKEILRSDIRDIDYGQLLRWIHKDPERKSRYYEAQEIGSEIVAAEMIEIADGSDSLEDVQRSKLRVETRRFMVGVWNKKRYGETKTIELGGSISITEALNQAQMRVIEGEVVVGDGE